MAFTYDLTTNRGIVRFNIGDTQENQGPRPDKRNFSDAEIDYLLSSESAGTTTAATAAAFEVLANEWAAYALSETEGEVRFDAKEVSDRYSDLADDWRHKPDGGTGTDTIQGGVIELDINTKADDDPIL